MGYYVFIEESNVCIPADRCEQALYDLNVLNQVNRAKSGFRRWDRQEGRPIEGEAPEYGEHESVHFSWMPYSFSEFAHVNDVLTAVGFETLMVDSHVEIQGYDNKHGCEDMILAAIAKHVVSYDDNPPSITWRGEEADDVYRDTFVNGGMYRAQAEIVRHFDHAFPVTDDVFQEQMLKAEQVYEELKGGE
jgi:hypothetical protein